MKCDKCSYDDNGTGDFAHSCGLFKPDWDEKAVLVKEMQRMGKELQESFKLGYDAGVLETQLDQAKERNFCPRCGKRLMGSLGPVSLHTCCPPNGRTFDDYGNKIT